MSNNQSNQSNVSRESKLRGELKESCIGAFYTQKGYFCKIAPAFDIDKVKFAFVELGKAGAGFDIYVDVMDFILLVEDILSFRLAKRIEVDEGQYPSAWVYKTGENGEKSIAIGKGQKGVVIQGRNSEKKANAFVPVGSYDELRKMATLFQFVSGMREATGYMKALVESFGTVKFERKPKDVAQQQKEEKVQANTPQDTIPQISNLELVTDGEVVKNKSGKYYVPIKADKKTALLVEESAITALGERFNNFCEVSKKQDVKLLILEGSVSTLSDGTVLYKALKIK